MNNVVSILNSKQMLNQHNIDHNCHDNGSIISEIVKTDHTIWRLYGMFKLVIPESFDTYIDVDLNNCLNDSLCLKQSWVIRWEKSIYANVKRGKQDVRWIIEMIWKYCNRSHAPYFFVIHHQALTISPNQAQTNIQW